MFEKFWKIIDLLMALILLAMILLVFTNVVLRYGFSSGLRPSIELSRLGLVWLVMIGAAVVLRRNEHLAVSEITQSFMPRLVPVLKRLAYVVILISTLMLFWGALKQTNANWSSISQLTGLPKSIFYLSGVISGGLMSIIAIVRIWNPDAMSDGTERDFL